MEKFISFNVNNKTLRGIIHTPESQDNSKGPQFPGIVLCHGFIGNKIGMHSVYVKAARYFSKLGFVVLRFDFSGCGDSDGTHDQITIQGQIAETNAALKVIREHSMVNSQQTYLIGLSMGGAVASLTAAMVKDLAGAVLWAPVANMYDDIKGIVGDSLFNQIWQEGIGDYAGFPIGRTFLGSLEQHHPLEAAKKIKTPLFIIHGTRDDDISCKNANLYKEARDMAGLSTVLHFIENADHTFSGLQWEQEVFELTGKWLQSSITDRKLAQIC